MNNQAGFKTYVLTDAMNPPTRNHFVRVSKDQRMPIDKLPFYRPHLQITFTDEKGITKTIRFKANSNEIDQDKQIKNNIPANEKFTQRDYDLPVFKNGALTTNNVTLQNYLEAYPGFEGFKGTCFEVREPQYRLYSKSNDFKVANEQTRILAKAATKILELNLEQTKELIYVLLGTHAAPSEDVNENQAMLLDYVNANPEIAPEIVEKEITNDDKVVALIGKLVSAELITFDEVQDQVAKRKDKKTEWIPVWNISWEIERGVRVDMFKQFLLTDSGKNLLADLNALLVEPTKEPAKEAGKK